MQTMQVSPTHGGDEPGSGELMDPTPWQYRRWLEPAPNIKGRKPASQGSLH